MAENGFVSLCRVFLPCWHISEHGRVDFISSRSKTASLPLQHRSNAEKPVRSRRRSASHLEAWIARRCKLYQDSRFLNEAPPSLRRTKPTRLVQRVVRGWIDRPLCLVCNRDSGRPDKMSERCEPGPRKEEGSPSAGLELGFSARVFEFFRQVQQAAAAARCGSEKRESLALSPSPTLLLCAVRGLQGEAGAHACIHFVVSLPTSSPRAGLEQAVIQSWQCTTLPSSLEVICPSFIARLRTDPSKCRVDAETGRARIFERRQTHFCTPAAYESALAHKPGQARPHQPTSVGHAYTTCIPLRHTK